jgi:hypothetical protein
MPNVTLVMTRKPLHEFLWIRGKHEHYEDIDDTDEARTERFGALDHGRRLHAPAKSRGLISGQWSTMAVVEGPVVHGASRIAGMTGAIAGAVGSAMSGLEDRFAEPTLGSATITLGGQTVYLTTDGTPIAKTTEFDALERFRTNDKTGFYVRLPARPFRPYRVKMFNSSTVADFHRKLGIRGNNPGMCLHVLDHDVKQQNGALAGILLHEAPNPGWLIGCISPRTLGNRGSSENVRVCIDALDVIYRAMGGFGYGKTARLIIFD